MKGSSMYFRPGLCWFTKGLRKEYTMQGGYIYIRVHVGILCSFIDIYNDDYADLKSRQPAISIK